MKDINVLDQVSYSSYKQSDVPWLEEVPEHWNVTSFKRIANFKSGAGFPVNEQGHHNFPLPFLKVSDMNLPGNDKLMVNWTNAVTEETAQALGATIFPTGSILFPKVGGAMLTNKRRVTTRNSCIDNNLMSCVVNNGDPNFVLKTLEYLDMGLICKPGPVPAISEGEVGEIKIAVPPLNEQAAIVRYLDAADQKIQAYISAKEKLIALLEELRQAIIHQAVTQGLDPNVKLKPSGVEWLGDVPEHWEILRLKSLVNIQTGGRDTVNRIEEGNYPFFVRSQTIERIDTWSYNGEAVLTAGDGVGVGKVFHYFNGKFDFHQRVYKFSEFSGILGRLFFHSFKINLNKVVLQGTAKSTVDSLRLPMLQNFPIPLPPRDEQEAIVDFCDKHSTHIDLATELARREIELMEEYRTRLIADVVTGKLDVRMVT